MLRHAGGGNHWMPYHEVEQGEYLAKIAHACGFSTCDPIWGHPANADLKAKRKCSHILMPGDFLFIPDKSTRQETCSTDQRHTFRRIAPTARLHLILKHADQQPIAHTRCRLEVGDHVFALQTDSA